MFVMTVTLMGAAMTMGVGISSVVISQGQLVAKQKAREALESVFTARNTQNIDWADIYNTGSGGIFLAGWQSMRETGADGIANTSDDTAAPVETVVLPGPDGYVGTTDDETLTLNDYQRRITITDIPLETDVDPDIRRIVVDIRFLDRGVQRTISVSAMISRFS
jgi:hypothetical protein